MVRTRSSDLKFPSDYDFSAVAIVETIVFTVVPNTFYSFAIDFIIGKRKLQSILRAEITKLKITKYMRTRCWLFLTRGQNFGPMPAKNIHLPNYRRDSSCRLAWQDTRQIHFRCVAPIFNCIDLDHRLWQVRTRESIIRNVDSEKRDDQHLEDVRKSQPWLGLLFELVIHRKLSRTRLCSHQIKEMEISQISRRASKWWSSWLVMADRLPGDFFMY